MKKNLLYNAVVIFFCIIILVCLVKIAFWGVKIQGKIYGDVQIMNENNKFFGKSEAIPVVIVK